MEPKPYLNTNQRSIEPSNKEEKKQFWGKPIFWGSLKLKRESALVFQKCFMMSGGGYSKDVKIVIVSTQYVETDAKSFKSVVQKLTGKDSDTSTAAVAEEQASGNKAQKERNKGAQFEVPVDGNSFLMRDPSFKEFDRLLREIPPINEL